jgi:hypothetical protein
MSRENVDVVAAGYREFKATQRPTGFLAPDLVWDMGTFLGWPDEEEYLGPDGFMEFMTKWREPYEEWDYEVEELVDVDDDRVVAIVRHEVASEALGRGWNCTSASSTRLLGDSFGTCRCS